MSLRVAELCAGYGGLGLGLSLAGVDHELVWWSEIDPSASTVMAAHTAAPNLGDLVALSNPPQVDLVCAGFPCQAISTAGRRRGINDSRWLIRDVVRVWKESGARWLVLENVAAILSGHSDVTTSTCSECGWSIEGGADVGVGCPVCGRDLGDATVVTVRRLWMGEVLRALAEVGATARWTCVRAADVGAPHRRERWFCVAHSNGTGLEGWPVLPERGNEWAAGADSVGASANSDGGESERRGGSRLVGGAPATEFGEGVQRERSGCAVGDSGAEAPADSDERGFSGFGLSGVCEDGHQVSRGDAHGCAGSGVHGACLDAWGQFGPAVGRWAGILGRCAPAPTVDGRLNPAGVEFMMGLPEGWVTDCGLSRAQALRVLGNGVVPGQAAHAIRLLTSDLSSPALVG